MQIQLKQVSVRTKGHTILESVSLELHPGTVVALAGPSGSGKTTLLNVAGLLRRVDSGSVLIDGEETTGWNDRKRVTFWRKHAAFIFQDYGLIEDESALYNVGLTELTAFGVSRRRKAAIVAALGTVGLADRAGDIVSTLSGGEKQRVGLARAMYRQADIVFADEPTASLDRHNRELVTQFLLAEARRGAVVVVATHDEALMANCDSVVSLHNARQPALQ